MFATLSQEALAAYIAAGIALLSLCMSVIAIFIAKHANDLNKSIAKRDGVIDLHNAWGSVNELDPQNLIGPDVSKAVNALNLTASLWNHDVIEKEILYQSYWTPFKELYGVLLNNHSKVPGYEKRAVDFLSHPINAAYDDMNSYANRKVTRTRL